jgi:N-terminal domain of anti-restriction factor ArdC
VATQPRPEQGKAEQGKAERGKAERGKAKESVQERDALLEKIKADFDERLATIASDPREWVTFIDQVALFGARYSLGNQLLLMMQADERGITPQFFLPYGSKDRSSGWLKHNRQVRYGETSFKVWAPVKRRPTEEQAAEWEAAGRRVRRDPDGRPAVQVVGFRLAPTFDPLSQESWWCAERPGLLLAGYAPRGWLEYRWLGRPSVRTDAERSSPLAWVSPTSIVGTALTGDRW